MANYEGPGVYRHYKGGEYEVLGLGLKEDTVDRDGGGTPEGGEVVCVVYRPLMEQVPLASRNVQFWLRELDDFNQIVPDASRAPVPRFERIGVNVPREGDTPESIVDWLAFRGSEHKTAPAGHARWAFDLMGWRPARAEVRVSPFGTANALLDFGSMMVILNRVGTGWLSERWTMGPLSMPGTGGHLHEGAARQLDEAARNAWKLIEAERSGSQTDGVRQRGGS